MKRGESRNMTNVENALLRQMQKMAASLGAMQGAVNKDKEIGRAHV